MHNEKKSLELVQRKKELKVIKFIIVVNNVLINNMDHELML